MPVNPAAQLVVPRADDEPETATDARLEDLLQQYGALLRRTVARVCPADLAISCDDIEQEARVSLWKALRSEREIAFPVSYIYKVAVSATLRAVRRARARREDPLPEEDAPTVGVPGAMLRERPEASPHAIAERSELKAKIDAALAQLAENRRLAVTLHLRGLTTTEIGALLGWTEAKGRNLVHRGLKDLRHSLRALGIEYGP